MKDFRHQHKRPKKNTLIVGRTAIINAMKEGKQLDRIYMQTAVHGETIDEIRVRSFMKILELRKERNK